MLGHTGRIGVQRDDEGGVAETSGAEADDVLSTDKVCIHWSL